MHQRVMSRFSVEFFCLTVPKHFVEENFYAVFQESSSGKKFMDGREVEVSRFSFENFLSHSAEKGRRGALKSNTEFGYTIFRRIFFRLAVPKRFLEEPLYAVFQKILGSEKDYG